ncbi:MAG: 50S ribosomal protein L21 [Mariprofundales bacterium]
MYAVIRTCGKQYVVREGDTLRVDKIGAAKGEAVCFDDVLCVGGDKFNVGSDAQEASVDGVVTDIGRGKKIVVFKRQRRKNYRLTKGHRQAYTTVRITNINTKTASAPADSAE